MSVILVTGIPGSGKTAHVVDLLAHDPQFKGRPLFTMGIPELMLDNDPCPPVAEWTEWRDSPEDESLKLPYFTFPESALVVLDEAQRIYRPRPVGSKVPPEVAAFETHRHTGIDFILITQHPGLLDSNLRKLVGRHIHIRVTPFGRYRYEWTELGDPESASSRELAAKDRYKLPKRAFALYKSSQLHTKIRTKMPWYVWLFAACVVGVVLLGGYAYKRVNTRITGGDLPAAAIKDGSPANAAQGEKRTLEPSEMLQEFVPVIPGRPETAPAYDGLRQVKAMPVVAGCIQTPTNCRCQNQQGLDAGLDKMQCEAWLRNPPFNPYHEVRQEMPQGAKQGQPAAEPNPQPVEGKQPSQPSI